MPCSGVIRTIVNSRTYQLSAQTNDFNKDDNKYFSHAITKLLSAEQLLDAICDYTGVPEKFTGLPAGTRSVDWDLADDAGHRVPAGLYFVRAQAGTFQATHRLIVVR